MNSNTHFESTPIGTGTVESKNGSGELDKPNFKLWDGLEEASVGSLAKVLDFFKRRSSIELAMILSQVELFLLARDMILTGGKGFPSPQGFIFVIAMALMIWAPALYHLFNLVVGNRKHGKNSERTQDPPQSRDDRGGA